MKFKFWLTLLGGAVVGGLTLLALIVLGAIAWMFTLLLKFLFVGAIVAIVVVLLIKASGLFSGRTGPDESRRD